MPSPIILILNIYLQYYKLIFPLNLLKCIIFSLAFIEQGTIISNNIYILFQIINKELNLLIVHLKPPPNSKWSFNSVISVIICIVNYRIESASKRSYCFYFWFVFIILLEKFINKCLHWIYIKHCVYNFTLWII